MTRGFVVGVVGVVEQRRVRHADVAEPRREVVGDPLHPLPARVPQRRCQCGEPGVVALCRVVEIAAERELTCCLAVAEVGDTDAQQPDPGTFELEAVEQRAGHRDEVVGAVGRRGQGR